MTLFVTDFTEQEFDMYNCSKVFRLLVILNVLIAKRQPYLTDLINSKHMVRQEFLICCLVT